MPDPDMAAEDQPDELSWQQAHRNELLALFHEWDGITDFNAFLDNRTLRGWSDPSMYWGPLVPASVVEQAGELVAGLHGRGQAATAEPAHSADASRRRWGPFLDGLMPFGIAATIAFSVSPVFGAPVATSLAVGFLGLVWFSELNTRLKAIAEPPRSPDWTDDDERRAVRAYWGDCADEHLRTLMRVG